MAVLDKAARSRMPESEFAGPGHSYPVNDPTHDRLAISGASHAEHVGNISPEEKNRIQAEAREKLSHWEGKKEGGDPKGMPKMDHAAMIAKMHPDHVHRLVTEAAAGKHGEHAMMHAHMAMKMPQDGMEAGGTNEGNMQPQQQQQAPQRSPFSDGDMDDSGAPPMQQAPMSRSSMFGMGGQ